jgi:hypothetical protein
MVQTTPQNTSIFPVKRFPIVPPCPVDVLAIAITITSTSAKLMQQELQLPRKKPCRNGAEMWPFLMKKNWWIKTHETRSNTKILGFMGIYI